MTMEEVINGKIRIFCNKGKETYIIDNDGKITRTQVLDFDRNGKSRFTGTNIYQYFDNIDGFKMVHKSADLFNEKGRLEKLIETAIDIANPNYEEYLMYDAELVSRREAEYEYKYIDLEGKDFITISTDCKYGTRNIKYLGFDERGRQIAGKAIHNQQGPIDDETIDTMSSYVKDDRFWYVVTYITYNDDNTKIIVDNGYGRIISINITCDGKDNIAITDDNIGETLNNIIDIMCGRLRNIEYTIDVKINHAGDITSMILNGSGELYCGTFTKKSIFKYINYGKFVVEIFYSKENDNPEYKAVDLLYNLDECNLTVEQMRQLKRPQVSFTDDNISVWLSSDDDVTKYINLIDTFDLR